MSSAKPLKEWLEQGVNENIIEKVPDGETITWCSLQVVQPKPKYADIKNEELESQMIRASTDMRVKYPMKPWNKVDVSSHQELKILSTACMTARSSGNWTWDKSITNWH